MPTSMSARAFTSSIRAHLGDIDRKGRDPLIGEIMEMFMMGLLILESSNRSPLSCASCRAGQIPAAVAPVGAPRNGEGGMLRKSAVAAAVAMLFALPALAQNPPAAPPVRVRGTIQKVDGANLAVKARDGMDVKVAVTDATRIQSLVKKSLADIKAGDFLASTGVKGTDGKLHAVEVGFSRKRSPMAAGNLRGISARAA